MRCCGPLAGQGRNSCHVQTRLFRRDAGPDDPVQARPQPDFDALVRMGKHLTGQGMSGVIYAGSMGDWPLLTDEQRMEGVERLVKAGIKVIVGTGAQNPMRAAALAAHAKKVGAAGLMVIPRVLSRGTSPAAQFAHFSAFSKRR